MKHRKALTALVLALALVGAFSLVSYAATGLQEISAYLNSNISIKLDGETKTLTDASGVRTYPITYNGTTYVPLRSVANLLGVNVDWDQATQTVLMGKATEGVDLIDTYKYYDRSGSDNEQVQSADKKEKEISGIHSSHWLKLHHYSNITSHISYNVFGEYDTLTFQYYAERNVILRVLGDNGSVLFERKISGGQVAQTVTVPLLKTSQITFQTEQLDYANGYTSFNSYIFDAKLT